MPPPVRALVLVVIVAFVAAFFLVSVVEHPRQPSHYHEGTIQRAGG